MFSQHRIKLFITLTLSVLLLGYWGFRDTNYQPTSSSRDTSQDIDGFLVNATIVSFNPDGTADQQLVSDRIEHYPLDDRTTLVNPDMLQFQPDRSDVRMQADKGEVGPNNEVIILTDHVRVTEQQKDGYRMFTDFLRIEPHNDFAETHSPVTLLTAQAKLESVGMRLYMDQHRVQFLNNVRGIHDPK